MSYIHTTVFYSVIKRNEVDMLQKNLENIAPPERKPDTKCHVFYDSAHMKCPELVTPETERSVVTRGKREMGMGIT